MDFMNCRCITSLLKGKFVLIFILNKYIQVISKNISFQGFNLVELLDRYQFSQLLSISSSNLVNDVVFLFCCVSQLLSFNSFQNKVSTKLLQKSFF